jgi:cytochrome o ubiquinol oxidase subunit 2
MSEKPSPGTFRGQSSHFSGDGFSDMHFEVRAVPPGQFEDWVGATRNAGASLDPASYNELAKQTINVAPFTYREVDPELYQMIVSQKLPPGPGPDIGQPDRTVSPRTEQ